MSNLLRSCAGCSAHILTNDGRSEMVFCQKCHAKHVTPFEEWAAGLKPGSEVYLQPYIAQHLSRSRWLVTARDGDTLTVQIIGWPGSSRTVDISHAGEHDLTPRT